jgi:zinc and cadmium transporter
MTLVYIIAATLAGGILSALAAAAVSFRAPREWIPLLVSFAVGALLGAAFLELIPHSFERVESFQGLSATILGGILAFFLLEKLVIWRHNHDHGLGHVVDGHSHGHAHAHPNGQAHAGDNGRSGLLIIVGDAVHNFVDGVLIAAAFMESPSLGVIAAAAVIAHEIPQEVGDFLVLLHSGYSRGRALIWNIISSLAMVVGGVGGYFALQTLSEWTTTLVAISAASMIYVAMSDLIPGLHQRTELRATGVQIVLIALGVALIWIGGMIAHGH